MLPSMPTYTFAGMDLLTAPWMQVWGSILGAALGAALAVYWSLWVQRRRERVEARAFKKMIRNLVDGLKGTVRATLVLIEMNAHLDAFPHVANELTHDDAALNRFSPFIQLGSYEEVAALIDLHSALGELRGALDLMIKGTLPGLTPGRVMKVAIQERCEGIQDQMPELERLGLVSPGTIGETERPG